MRTWAVFLAGAIVGGAIVAAWAARREGGAMPTGLSDGVVASTSASAPSLPGSVAPTAVGGSASLSGLAPGAGATPDEVAYLRATLVEERRRRAAAVIQPTDTGIDVLRRVVDERSDPTELMADFDRFAARVRPATGKVARVEPRTDGRRIDLRDAAADGATTIEFGPGRFEIDGRAWGDRRGDDEELEIRGAGKDKTTLVASSNLLHIGKSARHVRIHDLTFDGGSNGEMLLDVRGTAAVIVENVRFVGWRSAGHDSAIGVSGGAYLGLRACEFLGGRSGRDGGKAVSLRGNSIVLAKACVFADLSAVIAGWPGSTLASRVEIEDGLYLSAPIASYVMGDDGKPWFPVIVRGGRALLGPAALDAAERVKRWTSSSGASGIDTVTFGPDPAILTVGDLVSVAEAFHPTAEAMPYAIEVVAPARLDLPALLRVETWDPKQHERSWTIEWPAGSAPPTPVSANAAPPSAEQFAEAGSLAQAVRRSSLSPSQPVRALLFGNASVFVGARYESRFVLTVLDDRRVLVGWIDPKSGEMTPSPWK